MHATNICRSVLLMALLSSPAVFAANPELKARVQGIEDPDSASQDLVLADLDLRVDLVGALADVTVVARFVNPSDETLEGDFTLELPDGAVVTGYALDIEGRLVDGVLVDPLKARRAYQDIVRRGVDPGIANVSRGQVFSTRIFPIPEEGSRTIRLRFSAPVHAVKGLSMPLLTADAVGELRIAVHAAAVRGVPEITLPSGLALAWEGPREARHRGTVRAREVILKGEFRIGPVRPRHEAQLGRHHNGQRLAHIVDTASRLREERTTGRSLRVYWDRSLSRRAQKIAAERALLSKYVARSRPSSIDLVTFNSSGARVQRVSPAQLDAALGGVSYRGATSFAVLDTVTAPAAEICLVFSDGVVTLDSRPDFEPGCAVYSITSATDPDRGFLQQLSQGAAGTVLRLGAQTEEEILTRLEGRAPRVLQVMSEDGKRLRFVSLDAGPRGWSVITETPVTGPVVMHIGGIMGDGGIRTYVPAPAPDGYFDATGALWAAGRVAQLAAADDAREALVSLSRKFSVAGPQLSFLVLEQAGDYLQYDVEPPASLPAEWLEEFRSLKAEHDEERRRERAQRLDEVSEMWRAQVAWWEKKFDVPRERKAVSAAAPRLLTVPAPERGAAPVIAAESVGNSAEAVIVTGMRASRPNPMDAGRRIDIEMADGQKDRPYLRALDAAASADLERILAVQESKYGALPAFYFDVAEWLYRQQRLAEALEMLLSALDLPVANEETAAMVAERLQRYGQFDRAIGLLERAARDTDYLPQPRRDLALALAKRAGDAGHARARADLRRAMKLLNEVVVTPWDDAYDGIELIALMEANALLPRLAALDVEDVPLDRRLRRLLDVDLRVVLQWNTGATDMDLWVDEPGGERTDYQNPLSRIGGRLSNDMTRGYGPEEYLLRRAPRGEYRISVNVYATDVINPNGTTVVTARLYRDWGRPTQQEKTMEIELAPDDEGERLIGTFKVQ